MFNPFHSVHLLASTRQSLRFQYTSWRFTHRILTVPSRALAPAFRPSSQAYEIDSRFLCIVFKVRSLSVTGGLTPLLPDSLIIITKDSDFVKHFLCYDLQTYLWSFSSQTTIYGIFTQNIPFSALVYRQLTSLRNGFHLLCQHRTCHYCGDKHCRSQRFFPKRFYYIPDLEPRQLQ